jgi:hypothetical protein
MDEFEKELRQAFERRPAPPSLKRKLMQQRKTQSTARLQTRVVWWQRLAASVVLAGALGGAYTWHQAVERRKGEEAREQVFKALRITNHALNEVSTRLAYHGHTDQE